MTQSSLNIRRADRATRTETPVRADACIVCEAKSFRFLVLGFDRMQSRAGDFRYYRCERCGLVAQLPTPSPAQIAGFYPEDYEPHRGARPLNRRRLVNRLAISHFYSVASLTGPRTMRALFRSLSGRVMRDLVEPHGRNRMLDVGCGAGELMAQHRELGWSVTGIEPDSRAAALGRSRGLDVHHGTLFDAALGCSNFDVILMSQVIEHLPDPVEALRLAGRWLAPGGKIVLTTPNAASLCFKFFGSRWFPLEAPRHLFLFDPTTTGLLAAKAGFECRSCKTRCEGWIVDYSLHYRQTQAAVLPADSSERKLMISQSERLRRKHQVARKLVAPLLSIGALFGRGDLIRAELVAQNTKDPQRQRLRAAVKGSDTFG